MSYTSAALIAISSVSLLSLGSMAKSNHGTLTVEALKNITVTAGSGSAQTRGQLFLGDTTQTAFKIRKGQHFNMIEETGEGSCRIEFEKRSYNLMSCPWLEGFTDHQTDVFQRYKTLDFSCFLPTCCPETTPPRSEKSYLFRKEMARERNSAANNTPS